MGGIQSISELSLSNPSERGTVIAQGPTKNLILEAVRLKELHHAAQHGNYQVLSYLLDVPGLDLNAKDEMGFSPLMLAAWTGHTECVRLLLCKGVDVLIATRDNFTCLHMAAFCGHIEVVNLLLHGKSPRQCFDKWDPKITSSWDVRALMDQKSSSESFTALHMAAIGVHHQGVAIAASLLEAYRTSVLEKYGLARNPKVDYGIHDELWLDYLLQIRNILNLEDGDNSPEAIRQSVESYVHRSESILPDYSLDKYEGLVRSYAELVSYSNARDKIGRTALHYAAWKQKPDMVEFLTWDTELSGPQSFQLGSVVNVNATDVDGYTPLHLASRNGSTDVVIALLKLDGVAKDMKLSPRQNLLHKKIYLQPNPGARPNLHSRSIAKEILAFLHNLDQGQNDWDLESFAGAEGRAGVTPLHYAVEMGHTQIVKSLVEHPKIDVFQCTSKGESPWTIAFPSHLNRSQLRAGATESRWLLRSEKHRSYRQKLLKKATDLAVVADREGDADIDAGSQFLVLEIQILATFLETITGRGGPHGMLTSNSGESFQVIDEIKHENREINCTWEQAMERYSHRTSINIERISLLHVAAFEGCDAELEKLLELKKYKNCINDRENITCSGYTALHFAIMKCKIDTRPLAVLLNQTTLDPTIMNKKGQTPLQAVEHELRSERSKALLESKQLLMRHPDVKQFLENVHIDRQVYANAANALLVGAALIASISFAGLLQPPVPPMSDILSGDENEYRSRLQASARFSLCFYSALAAMLTGAAAAVPSGHFIKKEVDIARRWLIATSAFFSFSIFCILVAVLLSLNDLYRLFNPGSLGNTLQSGGTAAVLLTLTGFFYRLFTTRTVLSRIESFLATLGILISLVGFWELAVFLLAYTDFE